MDIIGLILGFAGATIIFFFGLPPRVRESGMSYLALEQVDKGEIIKGKIYWCISKFGLSLLAVGFLLQLLEKVIWRDQQKTRWLSDEKGQGETWQ